MSKLIITCLFVPSSCYKKMMVVLYFGQIAAA